MSRFMRVRNVSMVAAAVAMAVLPGACIKRTAPPPSSAAGSPAAAAPAPAPSPAQNAALEAANARIAAVPRVDLLGGAGVKAFQVKGEVNKVALTTVPVTGQPFTEAARIEIKEGSGSEWSVQITAPTAAPVDRGDAILTTFYLRTDKPQEGSVGETGFVFELAESPYTKSVEYPVQAGGEWTKVQVRFAAARPYAKGEAQAIFRLGYEPETIEIGGVQVESFGKQLAVSALPSTQVADKRREREAATAAKAAQASSTPVEAGELKFEVATGQTIRTISPYVYGINSQKEQDTGITVKRMGGNRQTAYNWENNASNAGSDYHHQSDDWPCTALGYRDCSKPGAQFVDFAQSNRTAGVESLATIPIVDWVTADKTGPVPDALKAPSARWVRSYAQKKGPLVTDPDLGDNAVYQDEFVSFLVQKLGRADKGGIRFYALDNEPALWPSTHPRIHPDKTTYKEMVARSEATALAITKLDPSAVVLGGVAYGWGEFMTLQEAPDAKEQNAKLGPDATYLDFFLAAMKDLETEHHRRLVHALDVHWYPEMRGTKRITEKDTSPKTVAARLQAPRSLWDATFTEKSWITGTWGKPIRLIPWLLERIEQRYPGTKLAMTEYNFGAPDHVSGGLAQADVLGVLGREGVYVATYWGDGPGNGPLPKYIGAAFKLFRNYDGKRGAFGDTAVGATADLTKASIYAATDSKRPGVLTLVVINKDQRGIFDARIAIKGGKYGKAAVYSFDGSSPDVKAQAAVDIKDNQIAYKLQPLSATMFVCTAR
jgi:hypothetical protein